MSRFSFYDSRANASSRYSTKSKASISMIELKERHLRGNLAQEVETLKGKRMNEYLPVFPKAWDSQVGGEARR